MDPTTAAVLLEQSPDAVIVAGIDGLITVWNPAAQRVFGFAPAEAIGQRLDIIVPEQFRSAHWTGYDRALEAGKTKYEGQALTTRANNKAGETIYVDLGFSIVLGADGKATGAMATARDCTERFNRDREMRRELRELKESAKA